MNLPALLVKLADSLVFTLSYQVIINKQPLYLLILNLEDITSGILFSYSPLRISIGGMAIKMFGRLKTPKGIIPMWNKIEPISPSFTHFPLLKRRTKRANWYTVNPIRESLKRIIGAVFNIVAIKGKNANLDKSLSISG